MRAVAPLVLAMLALSASVPTEVLAQTPAVDPAATQILKRMTDYLGSLRQFSVRTQNTLEDLLDSEHRVDHEITASLLVSRPDKLHAERVGDVISQVFYRAHRGSVESPRAVRAERQRGARRAGGRPCRYCWSPRRSTAAASQIGWSLPRR
jgi:hypothetical protein